MGMKFSDDLYNNDTLDWLNGNHEMGSKYNTSEEVDIQGDFDLEFSEQTIREEKHHDGCSNNNNDHHDDCDHHDHHDDCDHHHDHHDGCDHHHDHHDDCDHHHDHPAVRGGRIEVTSKLGSDCGEPISGVKVYLFRIEDYNLRFACFKITNKHGKVVFDGLRDGIYKVVQPMDKCIFRDPVYLPSDQVPIDRVHRDYNITVINRIRPSVLREFNDRRNCCNNNCNCCGGGWNNGWGCEGFWILLLLFGFCGCGFWF
ncbi:prealbumin-like fold domain-containing protein [Clostridium manihotivorum]|uniref:Uncharacterized protein n=1 Tax=Clostridium manihotivorum TaxID=2320868 RepID=A0A3R5UB04_9CLOT|nr:prealbumin-like fold domain-containing protein [Clostridium manihotivorum]QAA34204.1 hypothetical protein C1I91_22625 [Clostridium manihotivorum]